MKKINVGRLYKELTVDPAYIKRRIKSILFHEQILFINDESKYIVACCTRRAGKTVATVAKMFLVCMTKPNARVVYVRQQQKLALEMLLDEVTTFEKVRGLLGINVQPLRRGVIRFPNGSEIYMAGADTDKDQTKLKGRAWDLVIIDEAQAFNSDLNTLIQEVLDIAIKSDGQMMVIGTPGLIEGTFFDLISNEREQDLENEVTKNIVFNDWSRHRWSVMNNPHEKHVQLEIAEQLRKNPALVNDPKFRRERLGEWVPQSGERIYEYWRVFNRKQDKVNKLIEKMPDFDPFQHGSKFTCIAVDLGYNDPTAFVVVQWFANSDVLYVKYVYQRSGMLIDEIEARTLQLCDEYETSDVIMDGYKQMVESLAERMGIPILHLNSEKMGKEGHIEMFNSDMIAGKLKFESEEIWEEFEAEWIKLRWKPHNGKRRYPRPCMDHISDAILYCWYNAKSYLNERFEEKPLPKRQPFEDHLDAQITPERRLELMNRINRISGGSRTGRYMNRGPAVQNRKIF